MALDERRRNHLYETARDDWDEEAAETLMSIVPPLDWSDVATKQDLVLMRAEMAALRAELTAEMAALRAEMTAEMAVLRAEMTAEISGLRAEMYDLLRRQTRWVTVAVLGGMSVAAAVARLG